MSIAVGVFQVEPTSDAGAGGDLIGSKGRTSGVPDGASILRDDKPFWGKGGDPSFRVIPSSAKAEEIIQSQASIGFDHTGIYRDINVTFPIDRFRELAERGTIGSLATHYYSFMGATRDPRVIIEDTGPDVARLLKDEGVDVVLITPT